MALVFLYCFFLFLADGFAGTFFVTGEDSSPSVRVKVLGSRQTGNQTQEFQALFEEAKKLYLEEMDLEGALAKFKEAEPAAQTRAQKADVSFYLSLIHYSRSRDQSGGEFDQAVRRVIVLDYHRELDKLLCPPKYVELYDSIKEEYGVLTIRSSPSGADVFIGGSRDISGTTPLVLGSLEGTVQIRLKKGKTETNGTARVVSGQEAESPLYKLKRRSSLFLIIGGVAAVGGLSAVLLLGGKEKTSPIGSIQVSSTPIGAEVILDNLSTGQITNCVLTDVSVGSHSIKLTKEGYVDNFVTVNVTEGQTAVVDLPLNRHTISVTEPAWNTVWTTGDTVQITWVTGEEAGAAGPGAGWFTSGGAQFQRGNFTDRGTGRMWPGFSAKMFTPADRNVSADLRLGQSRSAAIMNPLSSEKNPDANRFRFGEGGDLFKRMPFGQRARGNDSLGLGMPFSTRSDWSSDSVGIQALTAVKIQLYKGDALVQAIADSNDNSGSYSWTVPTSLSEGEDYRIKISCQDDPGIADESDAFRVTIGYTFISSWGGYGEAQGSFKDPLGIAVSGYVYVADASNSRIQKFTSDGIFVSTWGSKGTGEKEFDSPFAVAVDGSGNVYVADGSGRIQKFNSSGDFLLEWTGQDYIAGQPLFSKLTVDPLGNVYATDVKYNRVQKFAADGTYIKSWGSEGSGDNQFNEPNGIVTGKDGFIYVADTFNRRILRFTQDGTFVSKWGTHGSEEGLLEDPRCIAADSSGTLFIGDSHRVQRFTADGTFLTAWGDWGSGEGEFDQIRGIAVDESGNVYVADMENHRVQKFGPVSAGTLYLKSENGGRVRPVNKTGLNWE